MNLPKAPAALIADNMTAEELRDELMAGLEDMTVGNVQDASTAFAQFREAIDEIVPGALRGQR